MIFMGYFHGVGFYQNYPDSVATKKEATEARFSSG
jgi:hypothetical protein